MSENDSRKPGVETPTTTPDAEVASQQATVGQDEQTQTATSEVLAETPVKMTFERGHYQEDPQWGLTTNTLCAGDPEYRKNGAITNFARALEAAKQIDYGIDFQLAIASTVAMGLGETGYAYFLTEIEIDPNCDVVNATYRHKGTETVECTFTINDINANHIPTLTGNTDLSTYRDDMDQNPHETLLKMVGDSKDLNASVYGVGNGLGYDHIGVAAIHPTGSQQKLAMLPLGALDLTNGEKATLSVLEEFAELKAQAQEQAPKLSELFIQIGRKSSLAKLVRGVKGQLSDEEARLASIGLRGKGYEIDKLPLQGAIAVMAARSQGEQLTEVPADLNERVTSLKEDTESQLSAAAAILAQAKAEGFNLEEANA